VPPPSKEPGLSPLLHAFSIDLWLCADFIRSQPDFACLRTLNSWTKPTSGDWEEPGVVTWGAARQRRVSDDHQ